MKDSLPDIQQTEPEVKIPINEVGVENVRVPFKLELKSGGFVELTSDVSMRTNISYNVKGVSMSRFLLTLTDYLDKPLKHKLVKDILNDMKKNVGSNSSFIKFKFKLPYPSKSIKSDNTFPLYFDSMFEGRLDKEIFRFYQWISVQYSSYCPCSAELSKDLVKQGVNMGFPHAQRSFAKVLIEVKEPNIIWLEEIIDAVYDVIKTKPYPIIKRIDEQEIAKVASENPLFVEDACRLISEKLNKDNRIYDWVVKCVHEESIHTSNAIAVNCKGVDFNGISYLL